MALRLTRMVALEDEQLLDSTRTLLSVLALVPEVWTMQASTCGPLLWHVLEAHPEADRPPPGRGTSMHSF